MALRSCVTAVLLLLAPAVQAASFDGAWSVSVVTERGNCDHYRWQVDVRGGRISSPDAPASASGTVDQRGRVRASFVRGDEVLAASGTVSSDQGQGRWEARARGCAGRWTAERRG